MKDERKTKKQLIQELVENRQEIADLKAAEAAPGATKETLSESQKLLEKTLHSFKDAIFIMDADPVEIVDCNPAATDIFGYSRDEIIGRTTNHLHIDKETSAEFRSHLISALKEKGYLRNLEFRMKRADGTIFPTEHSVMPLYDEQGKRYGGVTVIRDITERKQAEEELRESEERFRNAITNAPVPIMIHAEDEEVLMISNIWTEITGYAHSDIPTIGDWTQKAYGQKMEDSRAIIDDAFKRSAIAHNGEFQITTKSSETRIWDFSSGPLGQLPDGRRLVISMATDITERKQTEEELRESEERFRAFMFSATEIFVLFDSELNYVLINDKGVELFPSGTKREDIIGKHILEIMPDIEEKGRYAEYQKVIKTGEPFTVDDVIPNPMFGDVFLNIRAFKVGDGLGMIVEDVTERKQAEKALQESEEKIKTLLQNIPDYIMEVDLDLKILHLNKVQEGYSPSDFIGKPIFEGAHPSTVEQLKSAFSEVIKTGKIVRYEAIGLGPKGTTAWYHRDLVPLLVDNKIQAVMIIVRDITERKQAEEELRKSEADLKKAQRVAKVGSWVWHIPSNKLEWSDEMYRLFGIEKDNFSSDLADVIGTAIHPDDRAAVEQANLAVINDKKSIPLEYRIVWPDGTVRVVWAEAGELISDEAGNSVTLTGIVQDITERKQAEEELKKHRDNLEEMVAERTQELHDTQEQLLRNERLAALGVLAGGVGHELRNPLTGINNAVYFLKAILPDADEKVKEHLGIVSDEVDNAQIIITNLLDFGQSQESSRERADLDEIVAQVLEKSTAPENVKVSAQIAANLPDVYIDPLQISQALGNLVANAYQAMPDGGKLTIKAGKEGKQVHLSVTDNGEGISDENLKKIFEPLFTTKARGIGLGLALSKRLVEANGGEIKVESQEGKGSTFTVVLPIV